jgi:hypothetical protein
VSRLFNVRIFDARPRDAVVKTRQYLTAAEPLSKGAAEKHNVRYRCRGRLSTQPVV